MKQKGKKYFSVLRMFGMLSAGVMLAQIAAAADEPAIQPQGDVPTSGTEGSVIETLPAGNQAQLQDSIATLENKYDAETLGNMMLQIKDGKLIVVGVNTPSTMLGITNPSGL